jgi:thiamine-monophosphate kinase
VAATTCSVAACPTVNAHRARIAWHPDAVQKSVDREAAPVRKATLITEKPPTIETSAATPPVTVGDVGEFGVIARITAGLRSAPSTILGPGDDAAIVATTGGSVVASTDLLIEGRHFRRDWSTANDIGRKAAARNFADIAAMGASPTALLVGLACPPDTELTWLDSLIAGFNEECGFIGAAVVGGDVSAADTVMLGVTALGDLGGRDPVRLDGAKPGDVVAYSGRLGWAAAGFWVLSRGFRSPVAVVYAHRRPEPPYPQGPIAAEHGAHAMTDVSDGLVADLGHIASASGVRINLTATSLAPSAKLRDVGSALNIDPMTWVLTGGDDYALVATYATEASVPEDWTMIGSVAEGAGVLVDGRRWPQGGHEHFGDIRRG